MPKEKRASKRININLIVDYKSDGHYFFDFCTDLSTGGIFIKTTRVKPIGSPIDITITIPDTKETLKISGEVLWTQKAGSTQTHGVGMGVQFVDMPDRSRELIQQFISRYSTSTSSQKAS